jgi:hypothetical protein
MAFHGLLCVNEVAHGCLNRCVFALELALIAIVVYSVLEIYSSRLEALV